MFFITKKDSETGKKFAEMLEKVKECRDAQKAMSEKYGFEEYTDDWDGVGRIGWVRGFKNNVYDSKIWKISAPKHGGYAPRMKTKEGRAVAQEFSEMPFIRNSEINKITNPTLPPWTRIGVRVGNDYYGFKTFEYELTAPEWKAPADCEEVLESKFKELFK